MTIGRKDARLELDARLMHPLPAAEARALVALLNGRLPAAPPAHPLFRHPEAAGLLVGESLDHATQGSMIVQEEGESRLLVSASLPPCAALLAAGVDWLGRLLALQPGDIPGFVVPAGAARHDLRMLAWDGERLRALPAVPEWTAPGQCSFESFQRAAGLPGMEEEEAVLRASLRRVALAQLEKRCLPVSQARLDGALPGGQGLFRLWLARAIARLDGLATRGAPARGAAFTPAS